MASHADNGVICSKARIELVKLIMGHRSWLCRIRVSLEANLAWSLSCGLETVGAHFRNVLEGHPKDHGDLQAEQLRHLDLSQ